MNRALAPLTRRDALAGAACAGLAVQFMARRAYADVDRTLADRRLVVIICRGGMDGLSVAPPIGDPDYAALRGPIAIPAEAALKLDSTFALHPSLASVHALAMKGEARIAPAVATPDRERSHFEAQDVLESGATVAYGAATGWLNRALAAAGPGGRVKAMAFGPTEPLILRGPVETASWSPGGMAEHDSRLPGLLADLYANDPLLGPALASGLATEAQARTAMALAAQDMAADASAGGDMRANASGAALEPVLRQGLPQAKKLGTTLAAFMTPADGVQVAAVSMDNFDTHANEGAAQGQLASRLAYLDAFIDGLASGMGGRWKDTIVLAATEFGRTARVNGTGGTDHGTGSTALVLGGALTGGGIVGDWPTLAQNRLFENRDTYPATDMRSLFKGVLAEHLGLDRPALDASIFPGSAKAAPLVGLV